MISYPKFKEIFDNIDTSVEPEIELYFKNKKNTYMIIKYNGYITFQRCGIDKEQSGEIKFKSLDELYNTKTLDNIILKNDWNEIEDILFDRTFSIVTDEEEIITLYKKIRRNHE